MADQTQQEIEDAIRNQFLGTHEGASASQERSASTLGGVVPADFVPPLSIEDQIRQRAEQDLNAGNSLDVQAINAAAAKEDAAKEAADRENAPWWKNVLSNAANKATSLDKEDHGAIGAAAVTGLALPHIINAPEDKYGNPLMPTANKENEELYKAQQRALKKGETPSQDIVNDLQTKHLTKKYNIEDARINAEAAVQQSAKDLRNAALEHEYASKLNINDFLPPEMQTKETPSELVSKKPVGAVNWIHSEAEGIPNALANKATNMRKDNPLGGQYIIDKDTQNRLKLEGMGLGGYELTNTAGGAQLSLPTDMSQEEKAKVNRQAGATSTVARNIVEHQESARKALEAAQATHDANMAALRKTEIELAAHEAKNPISPERKKAAQGEKDEFQQMKDWNDKYGGTGKATKVASFIGRKLGRGFVPALAAAAAPEQAMETKRAYTAGDYPRMAAYGLSTLGSAGMATGVPLLSGLGAAAQIPAAAFYEVPELLEPPKSPLPVRP
jgi:hypothetical protein